MKIMTKKTKWIVMVVLALGLVGVGEVNAETTVPWCCVPNAGTNCVDSNSSDGCQSGYTAKTTGACSTISGCAQYSNSTNNTTNTTSGVYYPTDTGLPTNSGLIKGVLVNVANWLFSIIGIIALIAFVISGIQYFVVASDEKMAEKAKRTMTAAILGLVVALSGYIAVKTIEMLLKG